MFLNYEVEKILNMGESKEIKGLWWLPNAINNKIPGTLKVQNDRIVLETDAPYLSPENVRGTRNTSTNIKYVIAPTTILLLTAPSFVV